MAERLSEAALEKALARLPLWRRTRAPDRLRRIFRFPDFACAFAFMGRIAPVAEELGHHPDWSNSYDRVEISLTTHDAGGLTELDLALAGRIDEIAQSTVLL